MGRKQVMKRIRDEEGSGLVLTLLVLLVLSVLGTSLGMATIGSYRLSDANRDDASAYYIAEAGANWAYEEIKESTLAANDSNKLKNNLTTTISYINENKNQPQFAEQGEKNIKMELKVEPDSYQSGPYKIISTGTVDGKRRVVEKSFTISLGDSLTVPHNAAIIVNNDATIKGTIVGDAYFNNLGKVAVDDDRKIKGKIFENDSRIDWSVYQGLLSGIPDSVISNNKTLIKEKGEYKLETDLSILNLKLDDKDTTFNVGNSHRTIFVENFETNDAQYIELKGEGKLTLIVKSLTLHNKFKGFNTKGNSSRFELVYLGEKKLSLKNLIINGNILLKHPKAEVYFSGNAFDGILLTAGAEVELDNSMESNPIYMVIAPNGKVKIPKNFTISGTIIADKLEISHHNGGIKFNAVDISSLSNPGNATIKSEPALEVK